MSIGRQLRLFRNGRHQALRIPREFKLPGRQEKAPAQEDAAGA
jgi:virulence-associated protein VagC